MQFRKLLLLINFGIGIVLLSCNEDDIKGPGDFFQPEDIVGNYAGYCITETKTFHFDTGKFTTTRDTATGAPFRIDSMRYLPDTQLYKIYTFGYCEGVINYFVPEAAMSEDTIPLIQLTIDYRSYANIDTLTLDISTYFDKPYQVEPGGIKVWGYYRRLE
jgi:hypothetical protein